MSSLRLLPNHFRRLLTKSSLQDMVTHRITSTNPYRFMQITPYECECSAARPRLPKSYPALANTPL